LDVNGYVDDVAVPTFGLRMVCTVCGAIGADARPNLNERASVCLFLAHSTNIHFRFFCFYVRFTPKGGIRRRENDVRFGSKAEVKSPHFDIRFTPNSRH
jgi:hypothetical protein